MMRSIASILVVGGSDSSGGAGMQADCAVVRHYGMMPVCAVSCITVQGIHGLKMLQRVEPAIFESQLVTAFEELHPRAVKIGMIPDESLIEILIKVLEKYKPANVVLDPVMAPTSGNMQLCREMWRNPVLMQRISPLLTLITPNLPEASNMLASAALETYQVSSKVSSATLLDLNSEEATVKQQMKSRASALAGEYQFANVLLKGGHLEDSEICDCLYCHNEATGDETYHLFSHSKVDTPNTHGTGCALSTAIACNLITEKSPAEACGKAIDFLHNSLESNSNSIFFENCDSHGPAYF